MCNYGAEIVDTKAATETKRLRGISICVIGVLFNGAKFFYGESVPNLQEKRYTVSYCKMHKFVGISKTFTTHIDDNQKK